jgi:peptide deformylase
MLKLVQYPNDVLKKVMPEFDFDNPVMDPFELEEQMVKIMSANNGRGLAANQVDLEARVFVMHTSNLKDVFTPFALFNPKIVAGSTEENSDNEGCLSFPNLFFKVKRPSNLVVEFFDRSNNKCIIRLDDIDARCFLHELDHLNGVCFTDKISKLKLEMALKKQRKYNGRTK